MSLIYRALKSLQVSRDEASGKISAHAGKKTRSRIQQLQHRYVSPGAILITAGLLIIAGIAMVLGVEWLVQQSRLVEPQVVAEHQPDGGGSRPGDDQPPQVETESQPAGGPMVDAAPPPPEPFEAPEPPPVTFTGAGRGIIEQAATGQVTPAPPTEDQPVFVPPVEPEAEVAFISPATPDPGTALPAVPEAPQSIALEAPARLDTAPGVVPTEPAAATRPDPRDAPQPLPEGGGEGAMAATAPAPDTTFEIARRPVLDDTPAVTDARAAADPAGAAAPDTESSAAGAPVKNGHPPPPGPGISMKVKRQARYAVMAHQLRAAMDSGRGPDVEKLLGEITRLKGTQDSFVLKMRAYWYLKNQRYVLSEAILSRLLERSPGDLDVQLNMAVLESHTGRRAAATARLADLARSHPGEARVTAMAEMLN